MKNDGPLIKFTEESVYTFVRLKAASRLLTIKTSSTQNWFGEMTAPQ